MADKSDRFHPFQAASVAKCLSEVGKSETPRILSLVFVICRSFRVSLTKVVLMNLNQKFAGLVAAAVVGVVLCTSAVSTKNVPLEVGNQAPEISITGIDGKSTLVSSLKGEEVIVNFWSVKDAESRIANVRLAREAEKSGAKYIGMCIDADRQLAEEVMKADKVSTEHLYFADRQVTDEYQLANGTRTVKIDPYGVVAAID